MTWIWILVLLASGFAIHWGGERLAKPLQKVRRSFGLTETAGGALVGLATAAPEALVNVASVVRDVPNIGLGAMFGSNILATPLVLAVIWFYTRRMARRGERRDPVPEHAGHCIPVERAALTVQVFPYLLMVVLLAVLTLPAPWRGLQPIDGWIMLGAYAAYLIHALLRRREDPEREPWSTREVLRALAGVIAVAAGGYLAVDATEHLAKTLGISQLAGGLFLTGTVAALPEMLTARSVSRNGLESAAATAVLADGAVTITVALLPLALVSSPIGDPGVHAAVLVFVGLVPLLYAAFMLLRWRRPAIGSREVTGFLAGLAAFFVVMGVWVLPRAGE